MSRRICLVTTGQPSTDPRIVKEADALTATGYHVHVIGAHWSDWADRADADLLKTRAWSCDIIDWRRDSAPWLFWKTRVRHRIARSAWRERVTGNAFVGAAASRLTPELTARASAVRADLYIAHNLGALPAAAVAAARHGSKLGFDAEDFHSGQLAADDAGAALVRSVEERYLPLCDLVTAASPGIALSYVPLCRVTPIVVLNVFPKTDRPSRPVPRREGPLRLYWFSQTIGPGRGLEDAIAAAGRLSDRSIELHLRGVWQPGYAKTLQVAARSAGLAWSRVISHDPAAPAAMAFLAADYDAGLALEGAETSNADLALSNKIFTYILAGLPVVLSDTAAQSALAADLGEAAVLIGQHDVVRLAETLTTWIDRPEALDSARRAAWRQGECRYNWDVERAVLVDAVREMLEGTKTARAAAS